LIGLLLVGLALAVQPGLSDVASAFDRGERVYDVEVVEEALKHLEGIAPANRDQEWHVLYVRGCLLAAELLRIEFEGLSETDTRGRRDIGKRIDAHADAGLNALNALPDASDTFRSKADLLGAKIRSNYRAGKLKGDMRAAIDRALTLDPANALALVSAAKMSVFNPNATEEELRDGVRTLERANALRPGMEQAALMLAHAHQRLGDLEKATEIWRECLRGNPDCAPASRALARVETPSDSAERKDETR
jgi:tetratricopeptide (TPR) repeat protein